MNREVLVEALQAYLEASRRLRTLRHTEGLLMKLDAIADPDLRLHRFGEYLAGQPPADAARLVAALRERVARGDERAQRHGLGLLDRIRLERVVGAPHLEEIRRALEEAGEPSASLLRQEAARPGGSEPATGPPPREPVGYRVSLARRTVPRLIERLLLDPDARVIRTILGNPRLTEADVVKLAASRRTTPEVLETIALDSRWTARYPVKLALASNPVTPTRVTLNLLPYLLRQDLQALAVASSRPAVRAEAAALLAHRPGG